MKLALISDLHFGTVPQGLADELSGALRGVAPDLCVIAGDLTARARPREFGELTAWLDGLEMPMLVTPGNHDLPYWNLYRRFTAPFRAYLHASGSTTLMPFTKARDGVVLGLNTTRSWQPHFSWQEGVARPRDVARASQIFASAPPGVFKAVAAHHPLVKMSHIAGARAVRHGQNALARFAKDGVEALMSGHLHLSFAKVVQVGQRSLVAVGAPTALSWRRRGEPNGFWIIESEPAVLICTLWFQGSKGFAPASETRFRRLI